MLKENSKYSMGRIFGLVSFIVIIGISIVSCIAPFYNAKIVIPQELIWVFAVCLGYVSNTKVQTRLKENSDAINRIV